MDKVVLKSLQIIPGIGPSLAKDLYLLGVRQVSDLKKMNPQKMYDEMCRITHSRQDPCVLYTYRCAVYFAKTKQPDPELLKWWNWKDKIL